MHNPFYADMPVGTILIREMPGAHLPEGCIECDGMPIDSKRYPILFKMCDTRCTPVITNAIIKAG